MCRLVIRVELVEAHFGCSSRSAHTTLPALRSACRRPAENECLLVRPALRSHLRGQTAPMNGLWRRTRAERPDLRPARSEPHVDPMRHEMCLTQRTRKRTHCAWFQFSDAFSVLVEPKCPNNSDRQQRLPLVLAYPRTHQTQFARAYRRHP